MKNQKKSPVVLPPLPFNCAVVVATLALAFVPRAFAQTNAPTAKALESTEDVVLLTPFEVRTDRDKGYYSRETLQGGRTATALKDTPAAVTILNQQFLSDVAATNVYDAEIWAVNTMPTYNAGLSPTGSNNRGPNFSFFSRNYFLWYVNSDSYNLERFEFGRGPNGVLFGDGNIGGLASAMTKQAYIGKRGIDFSARVDSWGGYRATADINAPIGERAAIRLNLLHNRLSMWQDHSAQNRDAAHLAGTVKLFDKTYFRFEGEQGNIDRQIYITNYAEQASYWDRTTTYDGVTKPSTTVGGPGVTRMSSLANYFVDMPGEPGLGYQNWTTNYRSTGSGFAMQDRVRVDLPTTIVMPTVLRRDLNNSPRNAYYLLRYATSSFYLEQKFSDDLFAQIGYFTARTPYRVKGSDSALNQYYIDVNTVLPNGQSNPNFGKPYSENIISKTEQMNTVSDLRAFVAYRFDGNWMKSNLNLLAGSRFDKFDYWQARLVQTNGANSNVTNSANEYHFRFYWDNPVDIDYVPNIADRTFDFAYYTNLIHQRKFDDYAQLVTVNKFFDDRLTLILGGRMDHIWQSQIGRIRNDATTGLPVLGATYIPKGETVARTVEGGKAIVDRTATNWNGGLVYYVRPWVGVYYNYSSTFAVPDAGNNLIDGTLPPISHSESSEFGVKFNLFSDRVYADFRYYDSKQRDIVLATNASGNINNIWNQLGRTELATVAYRDTQSLALSGYEFEVTANPTRQLRLMANFTLPEDQRYIDALPSLRAYYAAHKEEWTTAGQSNTTIRTNLDTIETLMKNNASFAIVNNYAKYRANIYATYTVPGTQIKNLEFGGGANFVGKVKIGSAATSFDYLWADPFYLLSAHMGCTTKTFGRTINWKLNVKNILNQCDPVATSYGVYRLNGVSTNTANYIMNGYRYNDPREVILTATVKF